MKTILSIIALAALLFPTYYVFAQNKVVVIPMGSGAKGTNGQVQYNDEGKTAGAEVYYDKATGKLELPGELRTVDGSGNNRLWGKGRPGTGLLTHNVTNGYCTTSAGINHALSSRLQTWANAADVCPSETWVCNQVDLPTSGEGGACPIEPLITYPSVACDGTPVTPGEQTSLRGWVSDADAQEFGVFNGISRTSSSWDTTYYWKTCEMYRVWCCWE